MFQNDEQRGRACAVLTQGIPGAPWFGVRGDVEQPPSVPRPLDRVLERFTDEGLDVRGLEPWAATLLRAAVDFWNNSGDCTIQMMITHLDRSNQAMLAGLIQAYASNPSAIDAWIERWEDRRFIAESPAPDDPDVAR